MTININLQPEQEQAWREAAVRRGISVDDLVGEVLRRNLGLPPFTYPLLAETQEDERLRQR